MQTVLLKIMSSISINTPCGEICIVPSATMPEGTAALVGLLRHDDKVYKREVVIMVGDNMEKFELKHAIIQSMHPYKVELIEPIMVSIEFSGYRYLALNKDLHICVTGSTPDEVLLNFKDLLAQTFEMLLDHEKKGALSEYMKRDLAIKKTYLRKEVK